MLMDAALIFNYFFFEGYLSYHSTNFREKWFVRVRDIPFTNRLTDKRTRKHNLFNLVGEGNNTTSCSTTIPRLPEVNTSFIC